MVVFSKLLWCVGKAIATEGLVELAERIPFGVGWAIKVSMKAYKNYHEETQDKDIDRAIPKEMERLAKADPAQIEVEAQQIAAQILPDQPAQLREALAGTLALIPAQIRKTFTRKEDLTGKSRPPAFLVRGPEDLRSILPPRPPRFKEGDPLPNDPKWLLEKRLDTGGFGEVWKVRHATLKNRFAAVKFCLDPDAQERLLKHEARVIDQVMRIKNDNIVRLEEIDFNPDAPWLRYEFIEGGNLLAAACLPADPGHRAASARAMMLPLARAVGACHLLSPSVVHRDLKPANILIDRHEGHDDNSPGRLKITDFGISEIVAQQALDQAKQDTGGLASFATPTILRASFTDMYASPQQKTGLPSSPTDDVYALGVMWFQILMGDYFLPLGRDYRDDLLDLGLGDELIAVLVKCVADKAERRWPNAKVLAEQIEQLPTSFIMKSSMRQGEATLHPPSSEPPPNNSQVTPRIIVPKQKPPILDCTGPNGAHAQRVKVVQEQWVDYLEVPLVEVLDLDGVKLELILIPPGSFMMGAPDSEEEHGEDEALHRVDLTEPFYLSKYPITQEQWIRVMRGNNPSWFCPSGGGKEHVRDLSTRRFPVETVTWSQANAFCKRLATFGGNSLQRFCLPTEAQWEFACRAGTRTPFHFGAALNGHDANCAGNHPYGTSSKGEFLGRTSKVGQYPANAFGLYDMHGNVWQWCADWYSSYSTAHQQDPSGPTNGLSRVRRGGAWDRGARDCRAATRGRSAVAGLTKRSRKAPSERITTVPRGGNLGFRLLAVPSR